MLRVLYERRSEMYAYVILWGIGRGNIEAGESVWKCSRECSEYDCVFICFLAVLLGRLVVAYLHVEGIQLGPVGGIYVCNCMV